MDFLASPLGVFAILAVITIAAVVYEPSSYVGIWREFAKHYETKRRPQSIRFAGEELSLGEDEFAHVDASIDDEGLWILYNGPEPGKAPECSLIPWDRLRFRRQTPSRYNFQVRLNQPLDIYVSPELGKAMQPRSQTMPEGVE